MTDKFVPLAEIAADWPYEISIHHLRQIAQAQHGGLKRGDKARFSNKCLATYPRFIQGPGRKWGCFQSVLTAYWDGLRELNTRNIIPFRARKVVA